MQLRKELKFVMPILWFQRVKKQLDAIMALDSNCGPAGYRVRSLYFDSVYDGCLIDNVDGLLKKSKIRLRLYRFDDPTIKLEHKQKYGYDGIKPSLRVSRAQARRLISGDFQFLYDMEDPLARELYLRMTAGAYRPVSVIEYMRLAYIYPASDVRITFDTDIRASCVPSAFLDEFPALFPITEPDSGVLELKYNDFFPAFFRDIVSMVDSMPMANSKYAQARLDLL